jgi:hypothetical protein
MKNLISPSYREQNRLLHVRRQTYGAGGHQYLDDIERVVLDHGPVLDVLDYGAGKATLQWPFQHRFPFISFRNYDPVTYPRDPIPADMVVCTDVLEHIEPEFLESVLSHIRLLARKVAFVTIATRPAKKTLPDGRNAHLIQESADWWRERLETRWIIGTWSEDPKEIKAVLISE